MCVTLFWCYSYSPFILLYRAATIFSSFSAPTLIYIFDSHAFTLLSLLGFVSLCPGLYLYTCLSSTPIISMLDFSDHVFLYQSFHAYCACFRVVLPVHVYYAFRCAFRPKHHCGLGASDLLILGWSLPRCSLGPSYKLHVVLGFSSRCVLLETFLYIFIFICSKFILF